ncbi:phage portal protein [Paenibacillus larvae]|uniref:Phage portal protein, SPP1 family n=1 Tax=Paenibacillus larvae subsp. larvae TaxID=147375 RepID=A0A2L1U2E2_9BACL|nr:phage portal protein [Paenibacillus larvae]AVF27086.1 phage portal protein, SPP1 family [Paenibacillus larvae subsp. larvae]AVF27569.1 phage portal protein, SPP1 family [Paenibacillus larvae subsp. larvae]MCY7520897.1 phage portal protein [Paenibacillus larvae]MCY9500222.1 phage portal protein [Paenibacillus larvae]MCY9679265.1 phage portal protein [Paenibacillus larvae]
MSPEMQEITNILRDGAKARMSLEQIIQVEMGAWKTSEKRKWMMTGERYYKNKTDILKRERTAIGENGCKEIVGNLANNKLVNGFVRKLVDQKVGYLLSKPMSIQTSNEEYLELLTDFFGSPLLRLIKNVGKESINKGIAWVHPYYDMEGNLLFAKIPSEQCIPLWRDAAHTELDAMIRTYEVEVYEGSRRTTVTKVEWWDSYGVKRYVLQGSLVPDVEAGAEDSHFQLVSQNGTEKPMNWERVPFICFKYNDEEQPLIELIKSLVDDYDERKSDHTNNLEDLPDSIYVVKGFGGTESGEIRKNLSTFRIIKIDDTEKNSGVDTISLPINTEAYETHMNRNRKDIYEFGRGVDTQSEKFGGDKSGVALRFLYADLDMDANILETEFQASLEQLLWFINAHIYNTTGKDFTGESVDFIFNRDILINETEAITNAKDSQGVISDETIVANHPWVTNAQDELERLKSEKEEDMKQFEEQSYPGLGEHQPEGEHE